MPMTYVAAVFAAGFAVIHLFIGRLRFLDVVPRSRWLSAAGGVAVAYVFLHILPELSTHQERFAEGLGVSEQAAEGLVYLLALAGLATFHGLERLAKASRGRSRRTSGNDVVEAELFWLHIGAFALYNVLIGYLLLHREESSLWPLFLYFIAIALHFVTTDFGLREDHRQRYDRRGRWVIAISVISGWTLGVLTSISALLIGFLFSFLAGAIILNVLKEELPEGRQSRFWPFAIALSGCAALLLVV